jgi:carbonic anhydrase
LDSKLKEFVAGHSAFQQVKFKKNEERFKQLVKEGQNPKALFIGCSDSRVMPGMITNSQPGDLFVVRNIGNFIPPFKPDADYHATAAAIEYAVSVLEISDIIVCGHSHCGAIESLYQEIEATPENIHTIKWLELGEEAKTEALKYFTKENKDELLRCTEQLSIPFQINNLLSYPAVKHAVERGELFLHGWYYHIEDGLIEYYDDEIQEFKPLPQKDNQ